MKHVIRHLFMLPRGVRLRMVTAFALMAVIPLLAGVYVVTSHVTRSHDIYAVLCILLLVCIFLACVGFVVMRSTVWGVVDIARTMDELLGSEQSASRNINARELDRVERLVLYMDDQVRTARRKLDQYRAMMRQQSLRFRLPPLVPASLLRQRVEDVTREAERNHYPVGFFSWRNSLVTPEEAADDTRVPQWLYEMLKRVNCVPDAICRADAGYWVGWVTRRNPQQVKTIAEAMQQALPPPHSSQVLIGAWSHPTDAVTVRQLLDSFEHRGAR